MLQSIREWLFRRTLLYVLGLAVLAGMYAAVPAYLSTTEFGESFHTTTQFHAVVSLVVGLLLVFRTNTAYQRWWEARTLWGSLVNTSRNLAIKFTTIVPQSVSARQETRLLLAAFPKALKHHLRDELHDAWEEEFLRSIGSPSHLPQAIARRLYEITSEAHRQHQIDGEQLRVLDADLSKLMEICGACERILRTRIVRSYRVFARQCVWIFLLSLPWGIAFDFRYYTILVTIITSYFMIGLEVVAEHVEEPFGYDEDDLDLEGLCATIERSIGEVFDFSS